MPKTFRIVIWGSDLKYPLIVMRPRKNARREIIHMVGHSWKHWQSAMKEGRTLLAKAKSEA